MWSVDRDRERWLLRSIESHGLNTDGTPTEEGGESHGLNTDETRIEEGRATD